MLLDAGEAARVAVRLGAKPAERDAWARRTLAQTLRIPAAAVPRAPYVVSRTWSPQVGPVVFGAVGGVGLSRCDAALRAEVLAALRAAAHVAVRDGVTQARLHAHGIDAALAPDPAVMVETLFGARIRARASDSPDLARVAETFPDGWLAIQLSADFGDDATLSTVAAQLDGVGRRDATGPRAVPCGRGTVARRARRARTSRRPLANALARVPLDRRRRPLRAARRQPGLLRQQPARTHRRERVRPCPRERRASVGTRPPDEAARLLHDLGTGRTAGRGSDRSARRWPSFGACRRPRRAHSSRARARRAIPRGLRADPKRTGTARARRYRQHDRALGCAPRALRPILRDRAIPRFATTAPYR